MRALFVLVAATLIAACGPHNYGDDDDDDDDQVDAAVDGTGVDGETEFIGDVYAHSFQRLYKVNPDTFAVSLVGTFNWPGGPETELMTDIAVDKDGAITGITFGGVWAVDKDTAAVTFLSSLSGDQFNGLTFLPRPNGDEILVATGLGGRLWQIDPTGAAEPVQIGAFGGPLVSSGDIVSVTGFGTVATVKNGSEIDYLARIDETTGVATSIGSTGYADIWGIGYWRDKVFGFVATNEFVVIDVHTGHATYISTGLENWAGAGVTTRAPIEP